MLLFVAAEPMEFAGLIRFCTNVAPGTQPVHWARAAELNGKQILMIANGAGGNRAAQALDAVPGVTAVVSSGFCGALDPSLAIGDILVASSVQGMPAAAPQCSRAHSTGDLITLDHIAQTAAEKQTLRESGACAVDMEAAAVCIRARELGLRFFCVRAVTDLAHETFANDLNRALRNDGHFDTIQILRSAIRRPVDRLPELVRLRKRSAFAARTLGEFLADCRF